MFVKNKKEQHLYICVKFYTFYIFLFVKILQTKENTTYPFFLLGSLGEIGKHDRLKICSFAVIGSSPIVSNCSIPYPLLVKRKETKNLKGAFFKKKIHVRDTGYWIRGTGLYKS